MTAHFMKAAKNAAKGIGAFLTAGLLALSFNTNAQAQEPLPNPMLPATLAEASCIDINNNTALVLGGIIENEGLTSVGRLEFIKSTLQGPHAFNVLYNEAEDYGYIVVNKGQGSLCVSERLTDMHFQTVGSYTFASNTLKGQFTSQHCDFVPRYG